MMPVMIDLTVKRPSFGSFLMKLICRRGSASTCDKRSTLLRGVRPDRHLQLGSNGRTENRPAPKLHDQEVRNTS